MRASKLDYHRAPVNKPPGQRQWGWNRSCTWRGHQYRRRKPPYWRTMNTRAGVKMRCWRCGYVRIDETDGLSLTARNWPRSSRAAKRRSRARQRVMEHEESR